MLNKRYEQLKAAEGGAIISLTAYSLITIMKLLVGNIGHSEALIADGFNNSTDILASLTVLIGFIFRADHLIKTTNTVTGNQKTSPA